jgi:hypothetical protein
MVPRIETLEVSQVAGVETQVHEESVMTDEKVRGIYRRMNQAAQDEPPLLRRTSRVRAGRPAQCPRCAGPARLKLVASSGFPGNAEPLPIWLAALVASRCEANRNGTMRRVNWNCISGRAVYTNDGADPELIQPLGVRLQGGHTLAVSWIPGETAYTLEVYRQCA